MNTTQALRTDQSKEEEFANIIEVSEAYTDIYEYLQLLLCIGSRDPTYSLSTGRLRVKFALAECG